MMAVCSLMTYVLPILLLSVTSGFPLDKYVLPRESQCPLNCGRRRLLQVDSQTVRSNRTTYDGLYNATDGLLSNTPDQDVCKKSNVLVDNCAAIRTCRCDHLCKIYGDCCADINFKPPNSATVLQANITFQQLQNKFKCVELPSRPGPIHRVKLVVKCPDLFKDKKQRQLCENISDTNFIQNVPIFDKILDLSYRNIFCAECNSANSTNTNAWKVYTDQIAKSLVDETKGLSDIGTAILDNAGVEFQLGNAYHRTHSCNNIINTCPHQISTSSDKTIACDRYLNLIRGVDSNGHSIYFKNGHCVACNRFEGLLECSDQSNTDRQNHTLETAVNVDEYLESRKRASKHGCEENQMFDEMKGMCRNVVCSEGRVPSYGKCIEPLLTDTEREFVSRLQFRTKPAMTEEQCSKVNETWSKVPAKCNHEIVILNEVAASGFGTHEWAYYETYFACLKFLVEEITLPATQNYPFDRIFIRQFISELNGSVDIQFSPMGLRLESKVVKKLIRPSLPVSKKLGQGLSSNCPFLKFNSNEATEFAINYLEAVTIGKESVNLGAEDFEKNFNIDGSNTVKNVKDRIFRFHKNSFYICFDAYTRLNNVILKYLVFNRAARTLDCGPLVYSAILIALNVQLEHMM